MKNNIFSKTPNANIRKIFNYNQIKKPYKVVNLYIDNSKKPKQLNDDTKLYLYTHKLLNQFKIHIKDIKRIKSSSYNVKDRKTLFNCYRFFNKNTQTMPNNNNNVDIYNRELHIDQNYDNNNVNSKDGNCNCATDSDRKNIEHTLTQNNKNIKKQILLEKYNFLSEKALNNINIINKRSQLSSNNTIYFFPNFKTYNNILANKLNNQYSTLFPYNSHNNNNLFEPDFINITKINYMNTLIEKKLNTLPTPNISSNNINENIKPIKKENNVRTIPMKEKIRVFSFTNNKKNYIPYENPPQNYYEKEKYFYYNIHPENCGWLIKECFKHRIKWKECHSLNTNLYNFKWKEVALLSDFSDYNNYDMKQMINHYECNSCISNKYNLFLNLIIYCENKNIEVFKYIPLTIILDDSNFDEFSNYLVNFKYIFSNVENYIFENKLIKGQIFNRKKIKYKTFFPLNNTKLGTKSFIEIPSVKIL